MYIIIASVQFIASIFVDCLSYSGCRVNCMFYGKCIRIYRKCISIYRKCISIYGKSISIYRKCISFYRKCNYYSKCVGTVWVEVIIIKIKDRVYKYVY